MGRERIKDLIISSVNRIENPKNPLEIFAFHNIDELVDVLLGFLEFRTNEELLEGIGPKIIAALGVFSEDHIDVSKIPGALEDLSTGFESYLKKMALVKYANDPIKLSGDGINYRGLLNTTLGGLLEGKVAKANRSLPTLIAPIVTFSYSNNIRENIYDYIRQSRNEIHLSQKKNSFELMSSFRTIVAGYLFALEENLVLIRILIDPVFVYLTKLHDDFQKWQTRYVALSSEERLQRGQVGYPQLQVLEWQDDLDFSRFNKPAFEELINDPTIDPTTITKPSRKSVAEIVSEHRVFWLIGEPGSGKSTTLQALALDRANEILLAGYLTNPFPIFISANKFDKTTSFLQIICDTLRCNVGDVKKYLAAGKCWLLIDGINEISLGDQEAAFREIERLIISNDETPVLLSSRKYNFQARFGLPVYELLPLTDELVLDFLQKNMKTKDVGRLFFDQLTSAENLLLDFARNPLMLRMLTQVAREDNVPENRGQLFRQFTRWILSRETRLRKFGSNPFFVELVLSTIAFRMRNAGKINAPHAVVIDWISDVVRNLQASSDATQLFHELLDSHIFELDTNDGVTFFMN